MKTSTLRKMTLNEEVDYLFLTHGLKFYNQPRAKITALLRAGDLVRIKKGLYVFGQEHAYKPFVKETLANLIYGPSYISLEYALSFYDFIPERVETVTSVTNKKDKLFKTPIGTFTYRYLHPSKYPIGIAQVTYDQTHPILIATPEKALADKILLASPDLHLKNDKTLEAFLFEDLRIPHKKTISLDRRLCNQIAAAYQNSNVTLFATYLNHRKK
jgi:hypothetical protein